MSKNTSNRRLRTDTVDNAAYDEFTRRILRAYARRVASGDVEALTDMITLSGELENSIRQAVIGLRDNGYSWTDIAARLGVTRQAATKRWGR